MENNPCELDLQSRIPYDDTSEMLRLLDQVDQVNSVLPLVQSCNYGEKITRMLEKSLEDYVKDVDSERQTLKKALQNFNVLFTPGTEVETSSRLIDGYKVNELLLIISNPETCISPTSLSSLVEDALNESTGKTVGNVRMSTESHCEVSRSFQECLKLKVEDSPVAPGIDVYFVREALRACYRLSLQDSGLSLVVKPRIRALTIFENLLQLQDESITDLVLGLLTMLGNSKQALATVSNGGSSPPSLLSVLMQADILRPDLVSQKISFISRVLDVITSDKRADFVRVNRENLVQLKQLAGLRDIVVLDQILTSPKTASKHTTKSKTKMNNSAKIIERWQKEAKKDKDLTHNEFGPKKDDKEIRRQIFELTAKKKSQPTWMTVSDLLPRDTILKVLEIEDLKIVSSMTIKDPVTRESETGSRVLLEKSLLCQHPGLKMEMMQYSGNSLKAAAELAAVLAAMLNTEGGTILLGVSGRYVTGVRLSSIEKHDFRLLLDRVAFRHISPRLDGRMFSLDFIGLCSQSRTLVKDKYVIKIKIHQRKGQFHLVHGFDGQAPALYLRTAKGQTKQVPAYEACRMMEEERHFK